MFVIIRRSNQKAVTLAELAPNAPSIVAKFEDELLAEMAAHELLCHHGAGIADCERFEVASLACLQPKGKGVK